MAAAIEYDGSKYCGWQKQIHSPSIQHEVELALSNIANEPIDTICAGRTDTGVHGLNQIIHFDTISERSSRQWLLGANANLPKNIRIHWIDKKKPEFHARYSALTRTYRYYISNQFYRSALQHNHLTWEKNNLDEKLMNIASMHLLGEHDFTSFRAAGCQSLSPNRSVQFVKAWREDNLVIFEITANSFLHHMVRNIVGSLIIIGKGERPPEWISSLISERDRTIAAPTAPSNGLYLFGVDYPEEFCIPKYKFGPKFL